MYFSLRNWLGLAFLLAVAAVTVYWSRMETAQLLAPLEAPALPDGYYLVDAALLATDETGAVRYRMTAARAEEQPAQERLLLTDVQLEYRAPDGALWWVEATIAEAPADLTRLDLRGDVRLVGERPDGAAPILVQTTQVRLEPETWLASSKERVSITVGARRLTGVGLQADLMANRLELESDVHGQILR